MSTWIAVLTGLFAFVGVIAGHFVYFDLNAATKRREVRRAHIERFAELISDDVAWLHGYQRESLYGEGKSDAWTAPYRKAYAIFLLYFRDELSLYQSLTALLNARHEYEAAIDRGYMARLGLVRSRQALSVTPAPEADRDTVTEKHRPYYEAVLDCLVVASEITQKTIPEESVIVRWCVDIWARIRAFFGQTVSTGAALGRKAAARLKSPAARGGTAAGTRDADGERRDEL